MGDPQIFNDQHMKPLKLLGQFLILVVMTHTIFAETIEEKIQSTLAPLKSLLANDPSGKLAQVHLNEAWLPTQVLLPYFYEVSGPPHEYSAAREARVKEVEQWLNPYEGILIKVMKSSQSTAQIPNAVMDLMQFSAPSQKLRDALLDVGRNPLAKRQFAGEAYDTVFMLEMGDGELMNEIIEKIGWRDEKHTRAELGMNLLVTASTKWARPELLDMYQGFLSVPYKPENYPSWGGGTRLKTYYKLALSGLMPFGKLDDSLVSLMKARLAEINPADDIALFNLCKEAIMIAEGQCRPVPVVNFKGHFLGISKQAYPAWLASHPVDATIDNIRPDKKHRVAPAEDGLSGVPSNSHPSANEAMVNRFRGTGMYWLAFGVLAVMVLAWFCIGKYKPK